MKDIYVILLTASGVLLFFFFQRHVEKVDTDIMTLETQIQELRIKCQ